MKPCKEVFFSYEDDGALYEAMKVLVLFDIGCSLDDYDQTFGVYMEIGSEFHKRFNSLVKATAPQSTPWVKYFIEGFDRDKTNQLKACLFALQKVGYFNGAWIGADLKGLNDIDIDCNLSQSELIDNLILEIFKEKA